LANDNRIIGVDASLRATGVGVVEAAGNRLIAVEALTLRSQPDAPHSACLRALQEQFGAVLDRTRPRAAALEGGFFLKNARTALILGEARGVIIATCAAAGVPVYEYAPRKVKQAVVGTGAAHKEQVVRMVTAMLGLARPPGEDEADALALAICHLNSRTRYTALQPEPL
jgi:crossover junction endodeoxyribonuclease RuvC